MNGWIQLIVCVASVMAVAALIGISGTLMDIYNLLADIRDNTNEVRRRS